MMTNFFYAGDANISHTLITRVSETAYEEATRFHTENKTTATRRASFSCR
jgi:hypothetical protein